MVRQKETIIDVWENENSKELLFSFVLKESENENQLDTIVESLKAKGYIVRTGTWQIEKMVTSKWHGKLKTEKRKDVPGTIYLGKYLK